MRPRAVVVLAAAFLLPSGRVKNTVLCRLHPGWQIDPSARIGHVLILDVHRLTLEAGSALATGTVLRNLTRFELGRDALVGAWNWISTTPPLHHLSGRAGWFVMGRDSALTSRHYVDCSGGVTLGPFCTVAGVRSTFISHSIDTGRSEQTTAPITIGAYSLVSSNVKLTPGSSVPDRSVVGMGSVVLPGLVDADCLYAGAPAVRKRALEPNGYFSRLAGAVSPRTMPDQASAKPDPG